MGTVNWEPINKQNAAKAKRETGGDFRERNIVSSYLQALQNFPQIEHTQLVELFKQYNAGCTRDAEGEVIARTKQAERLRQKITECNLRLVVSIAKTYKNHNIPIEDLIQEGNIGLMKSVDRFKWEKGFRFSTYSTWWIKQAIGQHVLKRKRMIRLPAHAATVQRKMLQAAEEFREDNGTEPTAEELRKIICMILLEDVNDPRMGFVTITRIELTDDLRFAKVFYSVLGSDAERADTQEALEENMSAIKRLTVERINMKYAMELKFELDRSIEHSFKIDEILKKIRKKDERDPSPQ